MGAGWWKYHPKNGSSDLSKKWLKPSTGACFQLFLSTAPRLAKNLLKQALARLSADFTHFLKIHLIGDWAKPTRMAIHATFEPIAWRQLPFLGSSVLWHRAVQFKLTKINHHDIALQYFGAKANGIFLAPNFRANRFAGIHRRGKPNTQALDFLGLVIA